VKIAGGMKPQVDIAVRTYYKKKQKISVIRRSELAFNSILQTLKVSTPYFHQNSWNTL